MLNFSFFNSSVNLLPSLIPSVKSYNVPQILRWFSKGIYKFSDMTDLSKNLRYLMSEKFGDIFSSKIKSVLVSEDGSVKLAIELADFNLIECVLLKNADNSFTACLSSQVGCAMGCKFCRTGTLGLKRNLYDYEIIEEFAHLHFVSLDRYKSAISHIVFMGMGEPLANLNAVKDSISYLHTVYDFGYRKITISTCGVVPGINELEKSDIPVKLAVSLVTADDVKRSSLMPINKSYNLMLLKNALVGYQEKYNRRITLEYCMLSGINVDLSSANKLCKFMYHLNAFVNLIPYNPSPELRYSSPARNEILLFTSKLDELGINYTIRNSRGKHILGACGQLAISKTE